jgi:hypothetical protein
MSDKSIAPIAAMGIDTGKHSFRVIGLDRRARSLCGRSGLAARLAGARPSEWSERSKADGFMILADAGARCKPWLRV